MPRHRQIPSEELILENYRKPGHPTAFSAPGSVARHYNVRASVAKNAIAKSDTYSLHREYKRPRNYNPYFVYKKRELVQGDLIEISDGDMSAENDGTKHLLLLIDVFTRKVWLYPLKTKTGLEVSDAMSDWLEHLATKPKVLMIDGGLEFWNRNVKRVLQQHDVIPQLAVGTSKAAYAERANKTLQILIYKYLTDRESLRYIDVLDDLVSTYNKRGHRSLAYMSPHDAEKQKNQLRVRDVAMQRYRKIRRKHPRFKVQDLVRIKTDSKQLVSSRRAYAEQFKGEYYKIDRINTRLPIPLYYLINTDDGEHIDGGFYAEELTKVRGDVYKVEKVIKWRGRGDNRQAFVKWKYFGPRWNQWINATDIIETF